MGRKKENQFTVQGSDPPLAVDNVVGTPRLSVLQHLEQIQPQNFTRLSEEI